MTISATGPHSWPPRTTAVRDLGAAAPLHLGAESSLTFSIGSSTSPVEAMARAGAMTAMTLPRFLGQAPNADEVCAAAQAVLTELVDVTSRHRASTDLVGRVAYDGAHVTVSVGDMGRTLPAPEEEPGLYLVHRVADEVGQYAGDMGGRVTWAAVAA
ncbi:hypothetical protein KVH27_35480 [Streptomyces olivaceus]|uniref:hypothetical protein n=1 Tax=Streptomyces olivaceus TaxID=47716 RepID=UPI001CCBDA9D|nr:hypothetical protein [Streptomyces olivaceus]MBZ6253653.1 hypothetical protein [Streptomyces olivaceus]